MAQFAALFLLCCIVGATYGLMRLHVPYWLSAILGIVLGLGVFLLVIFSVVQPLVLSIRQRRRATKDGPKTLLFEDVLIPTLIVAIIGAIVFPVFVKASDYARRQKYLKEHPKPVAAPPATKPPAAIRRAESPKPREEKFAVFFGPLARSYGRKDSVAYWVQNRSSQTVWVESLPEMLNKGVWDGAGDVDSIEIIDGNQLLKVPPFSKKQIMWRLHANWNFLWDESQRRCRIGAAVFRDPHWTQDSGHESDKWVYIYSPEVSINLTR